MSLTMDANQTHSPAPHAQQSSINISNSGSVIVPLISPSVLNHLLTFIAFFLTTTVSIFGMFGNTANLIVYYKMGLQDTTTINFFVLAISDFTVSASALCIQISRMATVGAAPPAAYIASFFIYVGCGFGAMITALLSIERSLCIVFPLQVKTMVTSKRLTAVISTIATYQLCFLLLVFIRTGPPYDVIPPERLVYFLCSFQFPSFISFGIVLISSSFLIIRLRQSVKWRNSTGSNTRDSIKEEKVVRSVIFVCTLFIICLLPNFLIGIVTLVYPQFSHESPYLGALAHVAYAISFLSQAINSSVNIFVYYSMSTRFREVFKGVFVPCKRN